MTLISSRDNPWLKDLRRMIESPRVRRTTSQCWVEGTRLVEAALHREEDLGWALRTCVLDRAIVCLDDHRAQLVQMAQAQGARIVVLEGDLFNQVSAVVHSQGIGLVLARGKAAPRDRALTDIVVLDGLQDPGNLGSIIRSAVAAGIGRILLTQGTAEAFSPKALRAGAGAQFGVWIHENLRVDQVQGFVRAMGCSLMVTRPPHAPDTHDLYAPLVGSRLRQSAPIAWVFGQEGSGVGHDWSPDGHGLNVSIFHDPRMESLNVTAAAAVILFERRRCRTQQGCPVL